jgi:sulfur carrier protein
MAALPLASATSELVYQSGCPLVNAVLENWAAQREVLTRRTVSDAEPHLSIIVNGERRGTAARSLEALVAELELAKARVATALNGEFVPEAARRSTPLRDGDAVEIVSPRQGG